MMDNYDAFTVAGELKTSTLGSVASIPLAMASTGLRLSHLPVTLPARPANVTTFQETITFPREALFVVVKTRGEVIGQLTSTLGGSMAMGFRGVNVLTAAKGAGFTALALRCTSSIEAAEVEVLYGYIPTDDAPTPPLFE
jgi:hypothetical protein